MSSPLLTQHTSRLAACLPEVREGHADGRGREEADLLPREARLGLEHVQSSRGSVVFCH